MRVEVPEFKRCCCFLPLRYGLIFWGYLKMVSVGALWSLLFYTIVVINRTDVIHLLMMGLCITDFLFCIVLAIAAHRKNVKLLKVFYYYSITETALASLLVLGMMSWVLFLIFSREAGSLWILVLYYTVPLFALMIVCIVIQSYAVLLVRSELIKLQQDQKQFMFINNAAEAEAACMLVVDAKETDVNKGDTKYVNQGDMNDVNEGDTKAYV